MHPPEPNLPPIIAGLMQHAGRIAGELAATPVLGLAASPALLLDAPTRTRLLMHDPALAPMLRPLLTIADARAWYHPAPEQWQICLAARQFANVAALAQAHPALARHLHEQGLTTPDAWQLPALATPLLHVVTGIAGSLASPTAPQRFAPVRAPTLVAAPLVLIPDDNPILLALLQSRLLGAVQAYLPAASPADLIMQLPIPAADPAQYLALSDLAQQLGALAHTRSELEQAARTHIRKNLGPAGARLNRALWQWWELDFETFVEQVQVAFHGALPEPFHPEWRAWLAAQREAYQQHNTRLAMLRRSLDQAVYALYGVTAAQITEIETLTPFGVSVV
ncbi:MAG: hypothetical protein HC911_05085 [Chloroflexaceae bacterium]|nr:hypothetical protein [Chloroflexaceae bacterium]